MTRIKPKSFHHIGTFETGLSNCHKQALIFLKVYFKKFPHKIIEHLTYKKF